MYRFYGVCLLLLFLGVERVFIAEDFITVTKTAEIEWSQLRSIIIADIFEFFSNNVSLSSLHKNRNE
jgi:hypothetical protein